VYKIKAGSRVWVQGESEVAWRNSVIVEDLEFTHRHGLADDGGRWVFRLDDSTLLKVGPRLVVRQPKRTAPGRPTRS
jgi:hypothetical protein